MASIQGIYVALFGRPADPLGLAFWNEATGNGSDLSPLVGTLTKEAEYLGRFDGMSNEEIINSIYQSLFGRDAEPEGLAFFLEELTSGRQTIETIAINILDGAQGDDLATLNAKIAAADLFTAGLDTDAEIDAYVGPDAAQVGIDFLKGVDKDSPADTPLSDEWILKLFPDEGQTPGGGGGGGGGGIPVDPVVAAVNAAASDTTKMLAALATHEGKLFDQTINDLFDAMPEGQGRHQAVANGVREHIDLFGPFKTIADIKEVVEFHTKTEHAKFLFINAAEAATTQAEMLAVLEQGKGLSADREALITKWEASSSAKANDRAEALKADPYTVELKELTVASEAQLNVLASKLLGAGTFYGVGNIITALQNVDFDVLQTARGDFSMGGNSYNYIALGTDATDDTISFVANADLSSLNIKLYSKDVEIIKSNSVSKTTDARTPDIDLADADGVKTVWTDFSNAITDNYANYTNADTDTLFVVDGAKAYGTVLRVRFEDAATNNNDTAQFKFINSKAGSFTSTGHIDDVEHITYELGAGNVGGEIWFSGPDVLTVTVTGNEGGNMIFTSTGASNLHTFDASGANANITFQSASSVGKSILGGAGNDILTGGAGNDTISGGAGNDTINSGTGNDTINGGDGDDTINATAAGSLSSADVLNGGAGVDTLHIAAGALANVEGWLYKGKPAVKTTLKLTDIEIIENSDRNKVIDLRGSTGVDEVWSDFSNANKDDYFRYLGESSDITFGVRDNATKQGTISLRLDNETLNVDTVKVALAGNAAGSITAFAINTGDTVPVSATVGTLQIDVAEGNKGALSQRNNIENIIVTGKGELEYHGETISTLKIFDAGAFEGNLHVHGFKGDVSAIITGGSGNDIINFSKATVSMTINGGAGDDIIIGGAGNDELTGGDGKDTFVFSGNSIGTDTIIDFDQGEDKIDLKAYKTDFDSAAIAVDGDDTVITIGGGTITVQGVTGMTADDFLF